MWHRARQAAAPGRGGWRDHHTGDRPGRARLDVELAHEARELLRSIAALGTHRRSALTLRAAGYSYKEIQRLLGVTYACVNRHVTDGRQAHRRAEAATEAEVEAAAREAA